MQKRRNSIAVACGQLSPVRGVLNIISISRQMFEKRHPNYRGSRADEDFKFQIKIPHNTFTPHPHPPHPPPPTHPHPTPTPPPTPHPPTPPHLTPHPPPTHPTPPHPPQLGRNSSASRIDLTRSVLQCVFNSVFRPIPKEKKNSAFMVFWHYWPIMERATTCRHHGNFMCSYPEIRAAKTAAGWPNYGCSPTRHREYGI